MPHGAPNGTQGPESCWILWGASTEVRPGRVLPTTVGRRDLVVWREESGALRCLDAVCLHLGAHLGYGGTVIGDSLQCPFHGWSYDKDGVNVEQPGIKSTTKSCLRTYDLLEAHGLVYLSSDLRSDETQTFRRLPLDIMGEEEAADGGIISGQPLRWTLTLPGIEDRAAAVPGCWSWGTSREIFEWVVSHRAGECTSATSDTRWVPVRSAPRAEACAGPVSAAKGLHAAAPVVRFVRLSTDPAVEAATVGGGVHVARIRAVPTAMTNRPYRRLDRTIARVLASARLVGSVTQLTETTLGLTFAALYPAPKNEWIVKAADGLLRRSIGGRLAQISRGLDTAAFPAGVPPIDISTLSLDDRVLSH